MTIRAICCRGTSVGEVAPYLDVLYRMDRIITALVDMALAAFLCIVMLLFVCMAYLAVGCVG